MKPLTVHWADALKGLKSIGAAALGATAPMFCDSDPGRHGPR